MSLIIISLRIYQNVNGVLLSKDINSSDINSTCIIQIEGNKNWSQEDNYAILKSL